MIAFLNTPFLQQLASHIILILCITFINGFLLFAVVTLIIGRMKRTPAKHNHLIWLFLLHFFIAIPLASLVIPSIYIHHESIPTVETLVVENYTTLPETDTRITSSLQNNEKKPSTHVQLTGSAADTLRPFIQRQWQTMVTLLWLIGVMLSMIRIMVGRIGLHRMIRKADPLDGVSFSSLVETLCGRTGVKKEVKVLTNSQCMTPFTCYLLRPVIMLPANAADWPQDRLRIVLLHELAHIQRRDYVSRFIARILCALLWFVPPAWISHHRMQIEEEKACDASVINTGVQATEYAGHIIDIARRSRGMVLSLMLQLCFGRRSTLEPRIRNILRLRESREIFKIWSLIRVLFICFVCLLVLQVVNPVTAHDNRFFKREAPRELLYGRWINLYEYTDLEPENETQYSLRSCNGKCVIDQDGEFHVYKTSRSEELAHIGSNGIYTITDSYIDRKGQHYYKVITEIPYIPQIFHELWRIDLSGTKLEIVYKYAEYPSDINPNDLTYSIFCKM